NRLHLYEGDRLGLVLPVNRARRLLALHGGVEAVHPQACERCYQRPRPSSGLDQAKPADRPRLLSDNGSSYIAGDLAKWLNDRNVKHLRGALSSDDPGQNRALASDPQKPHLVGKLLSAGWYLAAR